MSKWGHFNLDEFEELKKRLSALNETQIDEFCRKEAKNLAARLYRKVKKRTPVGQYPLGSGRSGGTLRRGWMTSEITKDGDKYTITVYNPVEYAAYVEFGHRTANHKGWIAGRFMMTKSENELTTQAPLIVERDIAKFLKEVLSGK